MNLSWNFWQINKSWVVLDAMAFVSRQPSHVYASFCRYTLAAALDTQHSIRTYGSVIGLQSQMTVLPSQFEHYKEC